MKCKVRLYHLELVEVHQVDTPGTDYCTETKWEKVDDTPYRKVNIFWDETMYISSHLKDQVLSDVEKYCLLTDDGFPLQITKESIARIEFKLNKMLEQLYDSGNLSTRSGYGEQLILTKDFMYEYY